MTATASGRASPVAVLKPENPSIATTSMRSFHDSGRAWSQALNAALERPGIMSSSLAGPVLSLAGVRSMITDVLVPASGVAPDVLVDSDHVDGVEAGRVIDQQPLALGEDSVVGGVPGDVQPGGDPCDREVIDDQRFQRPPHPAAGEFRPLGRHRRAVLAPAVPAVLAPVAPNPHQQDRGPVAERLVSQATRDRAARGRPCSAGAAPRILLRQSTLEHRPLSREALPYDDQAEFVQACEGRQIGAVEGSFGHVEVFLMASVRTSIIGRPRRLSRHRRAHHPPCSYPLNCEEPVIPRIVHTVNSAHDRSSAVPRYPHFCPEC